MSQQKQKKVVISPARRGETAEEVVNRENRVSKYVDGIPRAASESLWKKAVTKYPCPKRGANTLASKMYSDLLEDWKKKHPTACADYVQHEELTTIATAKWQVKDGPPQKPDKQVKGAAKAGKPNLEVVNTAEVLDDILVEAKMTCERAICKIAKVTKANLPIEEQKKANQAIDNMVTTACNLFDSAADLAPACLEEIEHLRERLLSVATEAQVTISGDVADDWEELADSELLETDKVRAKWLKNIQLEKPFGQTLTVEQASNHPITNSTRIAASYDIVTGELRRLANLQRQNPQSKVMLADVGAGSFGAEQLLLMRRNKNFSKIFMHAMIPQADDADQERLNRLESNPEFLSMTNYVPETKRLVLGKLNYCHHKAKDCTCIDRADIVGGVAIHSAYYLNAADYANLFRKMGQLETTLHLKTTDTVPITNAEYEWVDGKKEGTFLNRLRSAVRERVTGIKQVVMKPLKAGGTTYRHPEMGEVVRNGGFHITPAGIKNDEMLSSMAKTAGTVAGYFAGGFVGGFVAGLGATSMLGRVAAGTLVGGALAGGYVGGVIADGRARHYQTPPPTATMTVETHPVNTFKAKDSQEVVAHRVRFVRCPVRDLETKVIESPVQDTEVATSSAAVLMMGNGTVKSEQQVAAAALRKGTPPAVVAGSIKQAKRIVDYLNYVISGPDPPPPDWWYKLKQVIFVCLPLVYLILRTLQLILPAQFLGTPEIANAGSTWDTTKTFARTIRTSFSLLLTVVAAGAVTAAAAQPQ